MWFVDAVSVEVVADYGAAVDCCDCVCSADGDVGSSVVVDSAASHYDGFGGFVCGVFGSDVEVCSCF